MAASYASGFNQRYYVSNNPAVLYVMISLFCFALLIPSEQHLELHKPDFQSYFNLCCQTSILSSIILTYKNTVTVVKRIVLVISKKYYNFVSLVFCLPSTWIEQKC